MPATIVLSICVPVVAGIAYLALRNRCPRSFADVRGIALQTVIVIVVLLAIAGAVAGVLIARGGEAVEELGDTAVTVAHPSSYDASSAECVAAGFVHTTLAAATTYFWRNVAVTRAAAATACIPR